MPLLAWQVQEYNIDQMLQCYYSGLVCDSTSYVYNVKSTERSPGIKMQRQGFHFNW